MENYAAPEAREMSESHLIRPALRRCTVQFCVILRVKGFFPTISYYFILNSQVLSSCMQQLIYIINLGEDLKIIIYKIINPYFFNVKLKKKQHLPTI